jgi:large subunit ribosomal protein L30
MAKQNTAGDRRTQEGVLRITLIRSPLGYSTRHKATVRALGLKRMHQTVELPDSSTVRGMIYKVAQLVKVEEA